MPFIAEDTDAHIIEVILLALFKSFYVALVLEFLCLEVVAGVELIRDGKRYDIERLQALNDIFVATNGHHLQHTVLSAVIAVFGATFTLCNPKIASFLLNNVMHVFRHLGRCHQHLSHGQGSLYDKRTIYTHKVLNPRIY